MATQSNIKSYSTPSRFHGFPMSLNS